MVVIVLVLGAVADATVIIAVNVVGVVALRCPYRCRCHHCCCDHCRWCFGRCFCLCCCSCCCCYLLLLLLLLLLLAVFFLALLLLLLSLLFSSGLRHDPLWFAGVRDHSNIPLPVLRIKAGASRAIWDVFSSAPRAKVEQHFCYNNATFCHTCKNLPSLAPHRWRNARFRCKSWGNWNQANKVPRWVGKKKEKVPGWVGENRRLSTKESGDCLKFSCKNECWECSDRPRPTNNEQEWVKDGVLHKLKQQTLTLTTTNNNTNKQQKHHHSHKLPTTTITKTKTTTTNPTIPKTTRTRKITPLNNNNGTPTTGWMNNRTITTQNYIIYTKAYNKDLNGYDNKMQQAS